MVCGSRGPGWRVDPGPPPGDRRRVGTGKRGDQRGRGGGVRDPHVAGEQAAVSRRDQLARDLDAHLDRAAGLVPAHRLTHRHVTGAAADLAGKQAGCGLQVGRHTDVDDGATGQEVGDHLRGDRRRPGRNPCACTP